MQFTLIELLWVVTLVTWLGWLALCFKCHAPARREVLSIALILLLVSIWSTLITQR